MDDPHAPAWKSSGPERIRRALGHQASGLRYAFRHDPAIREAILIAAVLTVIAVCLPVGRIERLLLFLSVWLAVVFEVLNSAIEACIDRISTERHPLSGLAKDYGSIAVAGTVVMCAVCWLVIAGPVVWQMVARLLS